MPFKYRLHVFFLILTILPLLLAGWIIQGVSGRNQENQVDSRLITTLAGASRTYTSVVDGGHNALLILARQPGVQDAVVHRKGKVLETALSGLGIEHLYTEALDSDGKVIAGTLPNVPGERFDVRIDRAGSLRGLVPYTELARVIKDDAGKNQNVYVKVGNSVFAKSGDV